MFEVILSEEALSDLDLAMDFYSNISVELGNKFMKCFDECLLQLEEIPFFQIRYDEMRIRQVKKFPILLHYVLYETTKTAIIYGVRFAQQNPDNYPKI